MVVSSEAATSARCHPIDAVNVCVMNEGELELEPFEVETRRRVNATLLRRKAINITINTHSMEPLCEFII